MVFSGELWPKGDVLPSAWHLETDRTQPVVAGCLISRISVDSITRRGDGLGANTMGSSQSPESSEGCPWQARGSPSLQGFTRYWSLGVAQGSLLREGVTVANS